MAKENFETIVSDLFEKNLITIPLIANRMSVSISTLERMVKAKYKKTPKQYITEFKLSKSASLLREGDLSVKQVASINRFNSVAYFCHCFKKLYGVTPKVYANTSLKPD